MGSLESGNPWRRDSVPAAFRLTVVEGRERLSFIAPAEGGDPMSASLALRPADWVWFQALDLDAWRPSGSPGQPGAMPPGSPEPAAPAELQNRRLAVRSAVLTTNLECLQEVLSWCPLAQAGISEARVWMAPDGPRVVGRFSAGGAEAPFTSRIMVEPGPEGSRRILISFAEVRLFGDLPLPASAVGAALAWAVAAAGAEAWGGIEVVGATIDIDPLEGPLVRALVSQGWRLPDTAGVRLQSELAVLADGGGLQLRFESGAGSSGFTVTSPGVDTSTETGQVGQTGRARGEHHAEQKPTHAGQEQSDTISALLDEALGALRSGNPADAAPLFDRVSEETASRGENEDASLAAEAAARARAEVAAGASKFGRPGESESEGGGGGGGGRASETESDPPAEDAFPAHPSSDFADVKLAQLAEQTQAAVARGDLQEADTLFERRLELASDELVTTAISAERARVQLLTPGGAARALETLRGLPLTLLPEEGLVLRADLAARAGDRADAGETLGELMTRAVANGDMERAHELAVQKTEFSGPLLTDEAPAIVAWGDGTPPDSAVPIGEGGAAPAPSDSTQSEEASNVTAQTAALYAEDVDTDLRDEALGELLQGFERLTPERQHDAYASFARVAESTGDLEHAEEAYWRATTVAGDPDRRAADLVAHARVLLSRGNVEAAVTELEEALVLAPQHTAALSLLAEQAFQAHSWERARALYALLDRASDIGDANEFADLAETTETVSRQTLLLRRAFLARVAGELEEAEACYLQVTAVEPRNVEALQGMAQIALEQQNLKAAAAYLEQVLRSLPLDAVDVFLETRLHLGEIYAGLHHWEPARRYFELVLAQDPSRIPVLEQLTEVYKALGLDAAAVGMLERLARLYRQPRRRAAALLRAGDILRERLGDEKRAFENYLKSSDADPTYPATALRLMAGFWTRGQLNDMAEVAQDVKRAGPLPAMSTTLRLRLAVAGAVAFGEAARAVDLAELARTPWEADIAAAVLAEAAALVATAEPATKENETSSQTGGAGVAPNAGWNRAIAQAVAVLETWAGSAWSNEAVSRTPQATQEERRPEQTTAAQPGQTSTERAQLGNGAAADGAAADGAPGAVSARAGADPEGGRPGTGPQPAAHQRIPEGQQRVLQALDEVWAAARARLTEAPAPPGLEAALDWIDARKGGSAP